MRDRVRFLGHHPAEGCAELAAAADVGVNLRRPPTYGETSAALLDLLRVGVPTIVTDVATFADYPGHVVRKVRWEDDGLPGLVSALRSLAADPLARDALGRAALRHVAEEHTWQRASSLYVEVIESAYAERSRRDGVRRQPGRVAGAVPSLPGHRGVR